MRSRRAAGAAAAVIASSWAARKWIDRRPALPADPNRYLPAAGDVPDRGPVTVTFLGVSTLIIRDPVTTLIIDGFFTRPPLRRMLLGRVAPDRDLIRRCLARADATKADAVLVTHSHYDHAMDAPVVAEMTGAELIGSDSTRQIGLGCGLDDKRIVTARPGEPLTFGAFEVTLAISRHAPRAHYPGRITAPLRPPARVSAYRMAECYVIVIRHAPKSGPQRTMVINSSAGFEPGMLAGQHADAVFLGIGTLGKQPDSFLDDYWDETVGATGARVAVPIHWDDFSRPIAEPLVPLPYVADDMPRATAFLDRKCAAIGATLRLPRAWQPTDPFMAVD